jgi:hypothetical protein
LSTEGGKVGKKDKKDSKGIKISKKARKAAEKRFKEEKKALEKSRVASVLPPVEPPNPNVLPSRPQEAHDTDQ